MLQIIPMKILCHSKSETAAQKSFTEHLEDALKTTDVVCDWAVDKTTWKTISATADLTELLRAYGKDVLNDMAKGEIVLNDTDRAFYEVLGYYGELHINMAYTQSQNRPSMPEGAANANEDKTIFDDIIKQIGKSSKK